MVRKFLFPIILLVICILFFPCSAFGPQTTDEDDASVLVQPVNDAAHALSPKTIEMINRELASFSKERSVRLKIVTLNQGILDNGTNFRDDACRLAKRLGFHEGLANRGVLILLVKGKGVGIYTTNDIQPQFENNLGRNLVAKFILPATASGDMDSAALYAAAAMTVLLSPLIPTDGNIIRASAKPGRLLRGGPFFLQTATI